MASSKIKTLLIFKFLNDFSDENNPLSSTDLIGLLAKEGIKCERKSIYSDIETLCGLGYDIISTNVPKKGYFMASRCFELPEVRLLIDAVSSAGFITPKKTSDLVSKLESLMSVNQAQELVSQVYIDRNSKCDNEDIYYVIDALHEAIITGHKVTFTYKRRNIDIKNKKSYTEKKFVVSPYALIWKDDHYYLVCNNQKYDNLMNLRLDRIRRVAILDEKVRAVSEVSDYIDHFDVADYSAKMFNMFSGSTGKVKLLCSIDIREQIMDRFGAGIPLVARENNKFETEIDAAISDGLVSWIMNFGNKIKVIEPKSLADQVRERAIEIAQIY